MKSYSLLLGAKNSTGNGKRFSRRDDARLCRITQRYFKNGFTIQNAQGGWFDVVAKRFVREESRQIIVCAESRAPLRAWCRELIQAFGQEELLLIALGPPIRVRRRPAAGTRAGKFTLTG